MKKEIWYKLFYIIGSLLVICFIALFLLDYFTYDSVNNSAPFYVFVIKNALIYLLPSIISFIVGRFLQIKYTK